MTQPVDGASAALDFELRELRREVERLRAENARLQKLVGVTGPLVSDRPSQAVLFTPPASAVTSRASAAEKVRLFRTLFAGRDDVYAVRWDNARSGRSGWMPAVEGGWKRERSASRNYLPLTEEVVTAHLTGDLHVGLYPLQAGDTCRLLACDFDGQAALLDALAYLKAARADDIPAALEVSRSGVGAHVWIFFSAPVTATTARRIGAGLLREAITMRGELDLSSYDRFFPSQDYLPASGSIGNLIALPLQGQSRRPGTTVFLDLATLEPYDDQWAFLSSLDRLTPRQADRLAQRLRPVEVGPTASRPTRSTATKLNPPAPPIIRARMAAEVSIERAGLPPSLVSSLKHAASLHNPEFYEREKQRLSTYNVPRFIRSYPEDLDWLHLPRGLLETAREMVKAVGSRFDLVDDRPTTTAHEFRFHGQLDGAQQHAVDALLREELGVLVAPTGAGKTVMACAAVARLSVPTLVLVHTKPLLDQWRAQIQSLLDVKPGQFGGGRTRRTGVVDLATLQTLARRDDLAGLFSGYGLVIVDECHHVPAAAFERAVRQLPIRRWLGLTATPYRRDRLHDMITMQCGPVRHEIALGGSTARGEPQMAREVFAHRTSFAHMSDSAASAPGAIQEVYRALVEDEARNRVIVADVVEALRRGRHCLVLTQWTQHVDTLTRLLVDSGQDPVVLRGGLGAKARQTAIERLTVTTGGPPLLAVATGSYLGEGFDCPALDTLFLTFPLVFKGRVVQYAGRVLRPHPDKTSVEIHDYVDVTVPVLARAHKKRHAGYTAAGFPTVTPA
jgi:superfamily II DNA or RNA helicase